MLTACGSSARENEEGSSGNAATITQSTEAMESETENSTLDEAEDTENGGLDDVEDTEAAAVNYDPTATGTYEDGSTPEFSGVRLRLTVNGDEEVIIALYDNTAVDALLERLPLEELFFFDLSGNEKPIERLEEPLSMGDEKPGYDPVAGEMVIYRPWGNFTIFYNEFRYSEELVPLGKVETGLEVLSSKTEDFTGTLELMDAE